MNCTKLKEGRRPINDSIMESNSARISPYTMNPEALADRKPMPRSQQESFTVSSRYRVLPIVLKRGDEWGVFYYGKD